jgi:hypothetical protein
LWQGPLFEKYWGVGWVVEFQFTPALLGCVDEGKLINTVKALNSLGVASNLKFNKFDDDSSNDLMGVLQKKKNSNLLRALHES